MRCCEKARWRSLIAKPPPEGTYIASVVRLALAALLTAAALANIGNSACAQRILWKRRRNGQAKHISVERGRLGLSPGRSGLVAMVRQSTFRLNLRCMLPVATVNQSTIRLNQSQARTTAAVLPVAAVRQSTIRLNVVSEAKWAPDRFESQRSDKAQSASVGDLDLAGHRLALGKGGKGVVVEGRLPGCIRQWSAALDKFFLKSV